MSHLLERLVVACVALGLAPSTLLAQGTSACRPADATSAGILQWVKEVVTSTDSSAIRQRAQMKLPQVAASQVTYVIDNRICSNLVAPYNARTVMQDASGAVTPSGKLYVIKVGTVYLAADPVKNAGEFHTYVTLDNKYRVLAASLG